MKLRNKIFSIGLAMLFVISTLVVALPSVEAQSTRATFPYIGATPNPVNVGGETLIHLGITEPTRAGDGWVDMTVTVTKPDGTNQTLGPFKTDSTGGTGTVFVPAVAGNYTLVTHFPEQEYRGVIYKASTSEPLIVEAIEGTIDYYPGFALPTEYWSRPIDANIREWYTLAGSWLVATPENKFVPYNDGPETAHVLWVKPLTHGGTVGGDVGMEISMNQGPVAFETGDAYEGKWQSRFIVAGVLIYAHHTSIRPLEYTAVDLHTGEILWTRVFGANLTISMAQLFYWQSYNYMGTYAYLWCTSGSTWYAYDVTDGSLRWTITNVPSGTTITGDNGEIYRYSYSSSTRRFTLWNMSALISMEGSFIGFGGPSPKTIDAGGSNPSSTAQRRAWAMNFTFPEGTYPGSISKVYLEDRIIGTQLNNQVVRMWGISLEPGCEGLMLFNNTYTPPAYWYEGNVTVSGFGGGWMAWSQEDKTAVLWLKETREHYAFSLDTGKYMWGPTEKQHYLDSVDDSASDVRNIAYGKLYCASVGGHVYAYDIKTGERIWDYAAEEPYTEFLWSNNWWMKPLFITDGKIYVGHTEHSANMPFPRGAPFICLNATTGEEIWRVDGMFRQTRWGGRAIIGDSIIATMDTYDQRIYAIGKGPSALTAEAPMSGVKLGDSVIIRGTVTDISPGTRDAAIAMRFPNGVPVVADECQSEWMPYVYKQFTKPNNATGVPVTISVIDANNNYRTIGTAISDATGFYTFNWEPDIEGQFTVYANFGGSEAYYGSMAATSFVVDAAPATPSPQPTQEPSAADLYFVPAVIGIIIAIIIVGLVLALLIRKRE